MRLALALLLLAGCDDGTTGGRDSGMPGVDAAVTDGSMPGEDAGPPPCERNVEICGDFMDQNCDGRDTSCGDTDLDGVMACRPGETPPACDCNDAEFSAYPPTTGLPGGNEQCDGLDNDCDGRFDEAALCCTACMALDDPERGDECTTAGVCECTTETGDGPCAVGETCCAAGCTDIETDAENCGACGSSCIGGGTDGCAGGDCRCGSGPPCDGDLQCVAGACV